MCTIALTGHQPGDIFKKIGDIAAIYCRITDSTTKRSSSIAYTLRPDIKGLPVGLSLEKIATLCSQSVFQKAGRYEVRKSFIISTQSFPARNTITGEIRATRIHDQSITWTPNERNMVFVDTISFNENNWAATSTCKYYLKETVKNGKPCSHVIGQLRRTTFLG